MKWFNKVKAKKENMAYLAETIINMHDKNGIKYEFEYVGVSEYYPNQANRSGYGSDEWMFLCNQEGKLCILSFQVSPEFGYVWSSVCIPEASYNELIKHHKKKFYHFFHYYFQFKENRVIGLHPDNIQLVKQLIGSTRSRMGEMSDKEFYGL